MNDLGWSLVEAGRLPEAEKMLMRAVAMDPKDELAAENLQYCRTKLAEEAAAKTKSNTTSKPRRTAKRGRRVRLPCPQRAQVAPPS